MGFNGAFLVKMFSTKKCKNELAVSFTDKVALTRTLADYCTHAKRHNKLAAQHTGHTTHLTSTETHAGAANLMYIVRRATCSKNVSFTVLGVRVVSFENLALNMCSL